MSNPAIFKSAIPAVQVEIGGEILNLTFSLAAFKEFGINPLEVNAAEVIGTKDLVQFLCCGMSAADRAKYTEDQIRNLIGPSVPVSVFTSVLQQIRQSCIDAGVLKENEEPAERPTMPVQ